ncbi:hypothetical protein ACFQ0G_53420 [Streptomyces chiangmaiensis]
MRSVQAPTGFDLLNAALRCLAGNLQEQGRDLPVLNAAVLHESRLELHLAEDTPPCAPFTAAADRQDLWTCTANHPDLADEDAGHRVGAPYPALVSIGWDAQGRYVLIDLEHIGLLHLDGDPDFARHVLQAIAVELANTPMAGHLEVTALGNTVPRLEMAVPERVARTEDADAATADLVAHASDQRSALSELGADSPRAARLRDDNGGDWTPHILLAEQLPDEPATDNLLAALTATPRTASAIIMAHAPAGLPDEAWTLTCQGPDDTVLLPGSGLPVRLQTLDDDCFHDAIELLTTADSDSDAPAPGWMRPDHDDPLADDGAGNDGLPDEYFALEQEALETETPAPRSEIPRPLRRTPRRPPPPPAPVNHSPTSWPSGTTNPARAHPPPGQPTSPLRCPAPAPPLRPPSTSPSRHPPSRQPTATRPRPAAANPSPRSWPSRALTPTTLPQPPKPSVSTIRARRPTRPLPPRSLHPPRLPRTP